MLVGALAVTVVGFILLVLALALSSAWLAWACIVVFVIGFGLLIADVLGMRRPAVEAPAAQPEADYPPTPAADAEESVAEEAAAAESGEDTEVSAQPEQSQEAQQTPETDTAEPGAPESAQEPAAQSEPDESSVQVADEGEDEGGNAQTGPAE